MIIMLIYISFSHLYISTSIKCLHHMFLVNVKPDFVQVLISKLSAQVEKIDRAV